MWMIHPCQTVRQRNAKKRKRERLVVTRMQPRSVPCQVWHIAHTSRLLYQQDSLRRRCHQLRLLYSMLAMLLATSCWHCTVEQLAMPTPLQPLLHALLWGTGHQRCTCTSVQQPTTQAWLELLCTSELHLLVLQPVWRWSCTLAPPSPSSQTVSF